MKYTIIGISLFIMINLLLFSMEWPAADGSADKNFGWNDEGLPILGVIYKTNEPVRAAENGELLFLGTQDNNASGLPFVLGTWAALDHGGGIIGIYSRMASENRNIPELIERSNTLGKSGVSGWTNTDGFYFSLFDRKERRWINPAMIINPPQDSGTPVILSVRLRDSGGRILELGQERTINQGNYAILVETARIIQGRNPLAPFRIICSVNGIETGGLVFETYSARDGVLMVYRNGLVPVRQVYSPYPAYELGTAVFARGQVTFEIIAQDAEGNSRNAVFRFTVE